MSFEVDRGRKRRVQSHVKPGVVLLRSFGLTVVILSPAEPAKRLPFDFLGLRASLVVAIVELLLCLLDQRRVRPHLHSGSRDNRQNGRPGRELQVLENSHHLDGELLVLNQVERPGRGYWVRAPYEHEVGHT